MQLPAQGKERGPRTEQIILFRIGSQVFAVSSASVQEVRSVDSLAGTAQEMPQSTVRKVRHALRRGERLLYIVNGGIHFGLPPSSASLVFFLRNTRTALLIDGIERMTTMTRLQALSRAFCHEEHRWYRGLTALDQTVLPVVNPNGFLSPEELTQLDSGLEAGETQPEREAAGEEDR